jgi:hypothetical protein
MLKVKVYDLDQGQQPLQIYDELPHAPMFQMTLFQDM